MEGGAAGPTTVLGRSRGGGRSGVIKDAAAKCFFGGATPAVVSRNGGSDGA